MDKKVPILPSLFSIFAIVWMLFWIGGCARNYTPTGPFPLKGRIEIPPIAPSQRPYMVAGHLYIPMRYLILGWTQRGIASWYGLDFHNRFTASGERYNMYDYTAAHKTLPLGTIAQITNIKNGKSIVVQINDRGPFVANRIVDLSYSAARALELDKEGIGQVKLTIVGYRPPQRVSSLVSSIGITNTGFSGLSSLQRLYAGLERKAEEQSILRKLGQKLAKVVKGFINWVKMRIHKKLNHQPPKKLTPGASPVRKGGIPISKIGTGAHSGNLISPNRVNSRAIRNKQIGKIHLQIATYRNRENAIRFASKFRKKGYNTKVIKQNNYYRVVVYLSNRQAVQKFKLKERVQGVIVGY